MLSDAYLEKKRRREAEESELAPSNEWMLTFSDLLMLLLTLFVLRLSMSTISPVKLSSELRYFPSRAVADGGQPPAPDEFWLKTAPQAGRKLAAMSESLQQVLGAPRIATEAGSGKMFGSQILVTQSEDTLTATLLDGSFALGGDELTFQANEALSTIAKTFSGPEFEVEIASAAALTERTAGSFGSDYELSTARALAVLRQMIDAGLDAQQLAAASYGSSKREILRHGELSGGVEVRIRQRSTN